MSKNFLVPKSEPKSDPIETHYNREGFLVLREFSCVVWLTKWKGNYCLLSAPLHEGVMSDHISFRLNEAVDLTTPPSKEFISQVNAYFGTSFVYEDFDFR